MKIDEAMFMTIAAVVGNSVLWLNQRSYGWKKREVCRDTTHQTHPPLISIISFMCMERHAHGHPNHPPCFLNLSSHVVHSLPTHFHYFHVYVFLCHGHPPFSIPSHPPNSSYPFLSLPIVAFDTQTYKPIYFSTPRTHFPNIH